MNIQQQDDGKKGTFFIEQDGEQLALMTYHWQSPKLFVIEHTEVSDQLEGKGVGKQLVHRAVDFAREKGVKIIPQCTFAKAIINKTPDYKDVLN